MFFILKNKLEYFLLFFGFLAFTFFISNLKVNTSKENLNSLVLDNEIVSLSLKKKISKKNQKEEHFLKVPLQSNPKKANRAEDPELLNFDNILPPPSSMNKPTKKNTQNTKKNKLKSQSKQNSISHSPSSRLSQYQNEKSLKPEVKEALEGSFNEETFPNSISNKKVEMTNNSQNENETQLKEQWIASLSQMITKEKIIRFIKLYKSGEIDEDTFFTIIDEVYFQSQALNKFFLIYAAENSVSYQSYIFMLKILEMESPAQNTHTYVSKLLNQYTTESHLKIFNQSLALFSSNEELKYTLFYLEKGIEKYKVELKTSATFLSDEKKNSLEQGFKKIKPNLEKLHTDPRHSFNSQIQNILNQINQFEEDLLVTAELSK